jgi:tetratricopeptide (TPR) repeat protein
MDKQRKKKSNKVVSLEMDAMFFFERAVRSMDRHRYDKALKYFRRAVEYDPSNAVNQCNLAGILSELGRYEESNEVLQTVLEQIDPNMYECHFYMANNYANMDDFESSEESIIRYLENEEDGLYFEDAMDMLEMISFELNRPAKSFVPKQTDLFAQHEHARTLMEEGKFLEASKTLKKAIQDYPEFTAAKNNLALAYYYMGQLEESMQMVREVLSEDPGNIHGLCNLAILYQQQGRNEELEQLMTMLGKLLPIQMEHIFKLATTMGILGQHTCAYSHFAKMIRDGYRSDATVYHYAAVASFNLKKFQTAVNYWRQAEKLDQDSTIAKFYLSHIDRWVADQDHVPVLSYHYHMPFEEQFRMLQKSPGFIPDMVKKDPLIRSSFFWALRHADDDLKLQVIQALGFIGDLEVEQVLREFLLRPEETDYLKKMSLFVLRHMGASEPFAVLLGGKETQIENFQLTTGLPRWDAKWQKILDLAFEQMGQKFDVIQQYDLQSLWIEFLTKSYPDVPQIRKCETWSAALEYVIAKLHRRKLTQTELAERYGVSVSSLSKVIKEIDLVCQIQQRLERPLPRISLK